MEVDIWWTPGLLKRKWTAIKCPLLKGGGDVQALELKIKSYQTEEKCISLSSVQFHWVFSYDTFSMYHINLRGSPKLFLCPQKYIPKITMPRMSNISVILCNQTNNPCTTISLKVQPDTSSADFQTAHGKPAGVTNELEFSRLCFTTDVFTHFTIYW